MEYKESLDPKKKRDIEIKPAEEIPEGMEGADFESVIRSLISFFGEDEKASVITEIGKFCFLVENSKEIPIELFNNSKIISLFVDVFQVEGYESVYPDIIHALTFLATFVDLDVTSLYAPETLDLLEKNVFPQIGNVLVNLKFYSSLLCKNPDGAFSFYRVELFSAIYNSTFSNDNAEVIEAGIDVIVKCLFSLNAKLNELKYKQSNGEDIELDADEFMKFDHDVSFYQKELCKYVIEKSRSVEIFTAALLHITYLCCLSDDEVSRMIICDFNKPVILKSFAENNRSSETLILRIINILLESQDPWFVQKWDWSPLFEVIDDKCEDTVRDFCAVSASACKTYKSFVRYIIDSGNIEHYMNFIRDGTFSLKDCAVTVIEAIMQHNVYDWVVSLIQNDYVAIIAGFIDMNAGFFLPKCIDSLTNLVSIGASGMASEEIKEAMEENEVIESIDRLEEETDNLDVKTQIEIFRFAYSQFVPPEEDDGD